MPSTISEKQALVLSLLVARGEAYGLELVEHSKGGLGRGMIYVTLGRMEEMGLVESWQEVAPPGHRGPARRKYRVTGEGARALDVWQNRMTGMFAGLRLALGTFGSERNGLPRMALLAASPFAVLSEIGGIIASEITLFVASLVISTLLWAFVFNYYHRRRGQKSMNLLDVYRSEFPDRVLTLDDMVTDEMMGVGKVIDRYLAKYPTAEIRIEANKNGVVEGLISVHHPKIKRLPNARLVNGLAFVMTRKAFQLYVEPTYADFCDEYPKSLAAGRHWHCRWLSVRVVFILLYTAVVSGVLSEIMSLLPKRS